ncbi:MAG: hypothetical protein ACRESF_25190, partial [Pseudomonas sp.]
CQGRAVFDTGADAEEKSVSDGPGRRRSRKAGDDHFGVSGNKPRLSNLWAGLLKELTFCVEYRIYDFRGRLKANCVVRGYSQAALGGFLEVISSGRVGKWARHWLRCRF